MNQRFLIEVVDGIGEPAMIAVVDAPGRRAAFTTWRQQVPMTDREATGLFVTIYDLPAIGETGALTLKKLPQITVNMRGERLSEDWSGTPDPKDPDNFWIDDKTGDRVDAATGERS